jgi:hypothetical protein
MNTVASGGSAAAVCAEIAVFVTVVDPSGLTTIDITSVDPSGLTVVVVVFVGRMASRSISTRRGWSLRTLSRAGHGGGATQHPHFGQT